MAATTISRATWTDGASPTGTVINNARLQADVYDKIDSVLSSNITFGGLLHAEGFGTHLHSAGGTGGNVLRVRNTSAGTGNYARVAVGNNATAEIGLLDAFSSTFTSSADQYANGIRLSSQGVGGLSLSASNASGNVHIFSGAGASPRMTVNTVGQVLVSDGTAVSAPGLAFINETDSGLWRENAGQWSLVANGVRALRITESGGNITFDTSSATGKWSSDFLPSANATYDLGNTSLRFAEVWCTAAAFNSSDARLKKNIVPVTLGLDFVRALRPVEYDWINPNLTGHHYGFIAQEIEPLGFAGVDTSNPDEYALRYTDLLAPMVRAIQELSARLDALEARA
jgi:hypothetical protein